MQDLTDETLPNDPESLDDAEEAAEEEGMEAEGPNPDDLDAAAMHNELTALRDEFETMRNQLMRTLADFQNFRKRKEAEMQTLKSYANEKLVLDLLPVLDNFQRTVDALQQGSSLESIKSGIIAVERQFLTALEMNHVTPVKADGQPFDPEVHEAVAHAETEEHPENTVVQVLEPGYRMAERVIRPARVRVSKKP